MKIKYKLYKGIFLLTLGFTLFTGCRKKEAEENYGTFQEIVSENKDASCLDEYLEDSTITVNNKTINLLDAVNELETKISLYDSIPDIDLGNEKKEINKDIRYTVKEGDTLDNIASTYDSTVDDIISKNNLETDTIYPNQELLIPENSTKENDVIKSLIENYANETYGEKKIEIANELSYYKEKCKDWLEKNATIITENTLFATIKSYVATALNLTEKSIDKITILSQIDGDGSVYVKVEDYTIENNKIKSSNIKLTGDELEVLTYYLYNIQHNDDNIEKDITTIQESLELVKKILTKYVPTYEDKVLGEYVFLTEKPKQKTK